MKINLLGSFLIVLFGLPGLASATEQSSTKVLKCTTGQSFETLSIALDPISSTSAEALFVPHDAMIVDNYANANLICTGMQVEDITCVGFWNYSSSLIAEVKMQMLAGKPVATYKSLTGGIAMHTPPWPCEITDKPASWIF